jgi:hypothetical protein
VPLECPKPDTFNRQFRVVPSRPPSAIKHRRAASSVLDVEAVSSGRNDRRNGEYAERRTTAAAIVLSLSLSRDSTSC